MTCAHDTETKLRAAIAAEPDPETRVETMDAEARERLELRSKATFGGFLLAAMQGRMVAVGGLERGRRLMDVFELEGGCTYTVDETGRLWRMGATWVLLASWWCAGGTITVEGYDHPESEVERRERPMRIEVTEGQPCSCVAPADRTRDGETWRVTCGECGTEWRIGLAPA